MGQADGYRYVEFASKRLPGFRNRIVPLERVPEMVQSCGARDCYTGVFLFDGRLAEHVAEHENSVAGYRGPCHARVLYVDIDAGDLSKALTTARQLVAFATDYLGADQESVLPHFSGNRGFHLGIHTGVFGGVEPGERVPDVLQRAVTRMAAQAKLTHGDTVDYSVGRRLSLLRLPNTVHSSSGLYKVPLTLHELLNCDADDILALAQAPRGPYFTDATGLAPMYDVEPLPDAQELLAACQDNVAARAERHLPPAQDFLDSTDLSHALCAAEMALYSAGVPDGARSWTALRLASRMRCAGYDESQAELLLSDWNSRNRPPMEEAELVRVVRVSYEAAEPYSWGCGTGKNDAPSTRLVYEACPYRNRMECSVYREFAVRAKRAV